MPYLSIKEASELTQKNEKTIRRLIKKPESKAHVKIEEGKIFIDANFIHNVYNTGQVSTQPPGHVHGQMSSQPGQVSTQDPDQEAPTTKGVDVPLPKEYYLNLVAAKDATIHIITEQLQIKDHQLQEKDQQINQLIERDRESNIIIQSLQDKMAKQLPQATTQTAEASTKPKEKISTTDKVLMSVALLSAIALIGFMGLMIYAYFNR